MTTRGFTTEDFEEVGIIIIEALRNKDNEEVLDNLRKTIQPASKRDDLIPVFNFNPNILKGEKTAAHRKWDTLIKDYKGKKI